MSLAPPKRVLASEPSPSRSIASRCVRGGLRCIAAAVLLWGCEGDGDSSGPPPLMPGLEPVRWIGGRPAFSCHGREWRPLQRFNPIERWDYMSLRSSVFVREELGELCGAGPERDACLAEVERISAATTPADEPFLLGTQRGRVAVFRGAEALSMFGEVDSADEAMWLVQAQSDLDSPCTLQRPTSVTTFAGGSFDIEVLVQNAGEVCPFEPSRRGERIEGFIVTPDGHVTHRVNSTSIGCGSPARAGPAID